MLDRLRDMQCQLLQDRARLVRGALSVEQQRKLVPAEATARDHLLGALDPRTNLLENEIARSVAKRIVDVLESVEVEKRQPGSLLRWSGQDCFKPSEDRPAARNSCQRIPGRLALHIVSEPSRFFLLLAEGLA